MKKILACIDRRGNTDAVIDWAAWAAARSAAPLEFLHVLERHPERASVADYSGTIGPDAQESLLQALSENDAQTSRKLRELGRELLAHARGRAAAAGVKQLDARLRHGEFVATAIELQDETDLFVLGEHHRASVSEHHRASVSEHHRASGGSRPHAEHHLEQVIRGVRASVLVATTEAFEAPGKIVVAYDGSQASRRALAGLAIHPLVLGLPVLIARVATDTAGARQQLKEAQSLLNQAGAKAEVELAAGEPQTVLPALVKAHSPALMVMGAFGHSRLRQWVLGSTTTSLLRLSDVPVLILR